MIKSYPLLKPLTDQLMKEVRAYGILEVSLEQYQIVCNSIVRFAQSSQVDSYSPELMDSYKDNLNTRCSSGEICKTCGKRYLPKIVLPVYSRLLYCCGLRPQEPPAIRTEDVNLITGDVYIRQSKRHKDRHIIMSEDMRALCQKYDSVAGKRQWFFQKWDGTPYETSWYNQIWRNLISKSGISWKGTPRPYDLRHAFASRNIIRWINNGKDVMELLPYLSAYMGHSELTSTLYYIHLLPENLRKSKAVDWALLSQVYGKGVPEDED